MAYSYRQINEELCTRITDFCGFSEVKNIINIIREKKRDRRRDSDKVFFHYFVSLFYMHSYRGDVIWHPTKSMSDYTTSHWDPFYLKTLLSTYSTYNSVINHIILVRQKLYVKVCNFPYLVCSSSYFFHVLFLWYDTIMLMKLTDVVFFFVLIHHKKKEIG